MITKYASALDAAREQYADDYLESSKKIDYTELTEKDGLISYFYDELGKKEISGYPFASDYVTLDGRAIGMTEFVKLSLEEQRGCRLRYHFLPNLHELYVGTTGSGKTTGCIEPQLRAISSIKNKPNLFLTDPKGELFDHNAKHLISQGYKVFMLNFKDLMRSDKWNPLLELYDLNIKSMNIGKGFIMRTGAVDPSLQLMANITDFNGKTYIEYNGNAFPNETVFNNYILFEKDIITSSVDNQINQLVNMLIPISEGKDRSWELGAQNLCKGIVYCMLEDSVNDANNFTREMMTLKTLQEYYMALQLPILNENNNITLDNHPLLQDKSPRCFSALSVALRNAAPTMRSYCGVFDGAIKDWFQGHVFALTTGHTIDIDNIGDAPFAIFIITRDYEKSDFAIAGLFIDWVYRKMLERAELSKKTRPLHFLLDEFGNVPEIRDFENKISTSRSRNIWFHLAVQSYQQISLVYGETRAKVIRDNCNANAFLGSQNHETKSIFSTSCGQHYIPSFESKLNPNCNSLVEVNLVPISDLDLITPGEIYTKRLYSPVIMSRFIRSYIAAANGDYKGFYDNCLLTCTPLIVDPYTSPSKSYAKLKNFKTIKKSRAYNDF